MSDLIRSIRAQGGTLALDAAGNPLVSGVSGPTLEHLRSVREQVIAWLRVESTAPGMVEFRTRSGPVLAVILNGEGRYVPFSAVGFRLPGEKSWRPLADLPSAWGFKFGAMNSAANTTLN